MRQSVNDLFRHRGGAIVVAVVLSIAGWAIVGGLTYLLWNLFWAQPSQQNDGRGGGDLVVAVCEAAPRRDDHMTATESLDALAGGEARRPNQSICTR